MAALGRGVLRDGGAGAGRRRPLIRVDSHHHLWERARGDYHWLTPDMPIHRDYRLADYVAVADGIDASVLVQAEASEDETFYLLDQARASRGLIRGVVGWADLAAHGIGGRIAQLARDPLLRGLRPMLQDIDDPEWILRTDVARGLDAMARADLRLDLLVTPRHLPVIEMLARRHPDLPMVIDHGAKPDIASGGFTDWAARMTAIADGTHAMCKLSGLPNEAGDGWTVETLRPYVAHLLASFGPDRLMWGSDWPVLDLAGGWARWIEATLALLPDAARDAVLGGTAMRFYGLGSGG